MGGKNDSASRKKQRRLSLTGALKSVKKVKTWQLLLILIPALFLTATCLRFDHIEMTRLREIVEETDEDGDDVQTATAVDNLKRFVFSHTVINIEEQNGVNVIYFGTGPFYLSNQYYRKAAAILAEVEANNLDDSNPNGNIYAAAMAVCKPQAVANRWVWNSPEYIACMTGEINKYPASDDISETIKADLPNPALYRYEFVSPLWTPTASGFLTLLCLFLIAWILFRFFGWVVIKIAIAVLR